LTQPAPSPKRFDIVAIETIIVLASISLYDLLLSDALSLPDFLRHSQIPLLKSLERLAAGLEFFLPAFVLTLLVIFWLKHRSAWLRQLTLAYLVWVTLRLVLKIVLVISVVLVLKPQKVSEGILLLKDTIVLWLVNIVIFGVWYWVIDAGGPLSRRSGAPARVDFVFPQNGQSPLGWEDWQPGLWDYIFLGFSGSVQLGLGDTSVLSVRAKTLVMLQCLLSLAIMVFLATFAISLLR
jgi:hypothetical protein